MKKAFIIFITASSLFNCEKIEQRTSDEVLFSITNECQANIKFYNVIDGNQSLSDIFDCSYVSFIALHIQPGTYNVRAESPSGRSVEKVFTKGKYSQELNIEF